MHKVGVWIAVFAAMTSGAPERPSGKASMPSGISVVNSIDAHRVGRLFDTRDPTLNAYTNPRTSGVTFRTSWADVEPEDGTFDFAKIDTVFADAEKGGKWVELIIIPGFGTPGWAMQGVQAGTFTIGYGPGSGTPLPLPASWDRTYLSRWFTFLQAISSRYGSRPSFRKIAAASPTSVSAEMSLPDSASDLVQWERLGYTSDKYIDAWRQTFKAYATIFPHQYFSLALHAGLPIPKATQRAYVRDQVLNLGLQYPGQFALQEDGLNALRGAGTFGYRAVLQYSGQLVTGFMMNTTITLRPPQMGHSSDPNEVLQACIAIGLAPNDKGQGVKYLEIYEPDILNPAMQQVLHDGQRQLLKNSAP